jgi:hypothetical protein
MLHPAMQFSSFYMKEAAILTTTCEQKAAVLLYGVLVLHGLQLHEESLVKERERSPAVFKGIVSRAGLGF